MAKISAQKKLFARLLLLGLLFLVVWLVRHYQQSAQTQPTPSPPATTGTTPTTNNPIPAYALQVLEYVRRNGEAPQGYVGGKEFQNREKRLPAKDGTGKRIRYSEWDVKPKVEGQNRGPERLVTGSDHSAWYTKDHYKNFLKID
jgi:ribonuclease T1